MKIDIIVGTRPEIIKMAPILQDARSKNLDVTLIHTGQHYDTNMSESFFSELGLPTPDVYLNVGSGSHGTQTAKIIVRVEKTLKRTNPDVLLVCGDTNSCLGSSLAASKLGIRVGHVEAGCRSFDTRMPEEINRLVVSDLTTIHFAPTAIQRKNLLSEGIRKEAIFVTGHPLVDLIARHRLRIDSLRVLQNFGLKSGAYCFLTCHRQENVDDPRILNGLFTALNHFSRRIPIVFPIHPRTHKRFVEFKFQGLLDNMILAPPLKYFDTLQLMKGAKMVITDSGGVQQEAALLGTPCVTIRSTTEWMETVNHKINFISGQTGAGVTRTIKHVEQNLNRIKSNFRHTRYVFGKPGSSLRILYLLTNQDWC